MHIDVESLIVDHIMKHFSRLKNFGCQIILIEIMDREMHCLDVPLGVVFKHFWPVYTSVSMVDFCLNVENPCNTRFMKFLGVFFKLGVLP